MAWVALGGHAVSLSSPTIPRCHPRHIRVGPRLLGRSTMVAETNPQELRHLFLRASHFRHHFRSLIPDGNLEPLNSFEDADHARYRRSCARPILGRKGERRDSSPLHVHAKLSLQKRLSRQGREVDGEEVRDPRAAIDSCALLLVYVVYVVYVLLCQPGKLRVVLVRLRSQLSPGWKA